MSFRLKIALLSGLTTAVLLLGTGWVLWEINVRENQLRIDRDLLDLGQGNLSRRHSGNHYERLDDALKLLPSGTGERPFYVMSFIDQRNGMEYQSEDWPANLDALDMKPNENYMLGHERRLEEYQRFRGRPFRREEGEPRPRPDGDPFFREEDRNGGDRGPRRGGRRGPEDQMDLPLKLPRFETRTGPDGTEWRIVVMGNPVNTLLLGADMTTFHLRMLELRRNYLVTVVIGLLFVAGCAWLLAGRALSPVRQLSDALRNVNSRGLGQRLNPSGFDRDFMEMIDVFNGMMNRLESSFHQATRFSADASHELKTPLAILQGEIETALQHAADGSDDQRRWSELLGEIQRLKSIVQKLLLLSQADTGELKLDRTEVVLSEVVENHVEDLGILAEGLEVESEIQPGIVAPVDQTLIQQVIQNLLSNAVKYNREGGRVRVELKQAEGSRPVLSVGNTGDPIPESSRDRVFDRFFRADASRSRVVEGTGLGLSLSLEIVKAHGGELKLAYSESDWTEFQVVF